MQFKDYYDTLGVKPAAPADEIKAAYRRLARRYHPDVSKEAKAEERFKAVNEAYEALRDPEKRTAYDQMRNQGYRPGQEFRPPPDMGRGYSFDASDDIVGSKAGFSDFFESLFGRGRRESATNAPQSKEQARIEVDLETVYTGGRQRISVHGRVLDVRIPKGILHGQQIRLAGQSSAGGDLLLDVAYRPHPQFQVEGREVRITLQLTPWQSALGAEVTVQTLGGPVQLRVPANSDTGKRLRLRGRGLPATLPGDPPGDAIVIIEVRVPSVQTEQQREAYRQLESAFGGSQVKA